MNWWLHAGPQSNPNVMAPQLNLIVSAPSELVTPIVIGLQAPPLSTHAIGVNAGFSLAKSFFASENTLVGTGVAQ